MSITRREFGQIALTGVPAAGVAMHMGLGSAWAQAAKPMSRWAGVLVGLNVPYSLGTGNNIAAEDLLTRIVDVGFGAVELRAQPVEHYLGSPTIRAAAEAAAARGAAGGGGRGRQGGGAAAGEAGAARGGAAAGEAGAARGGGGRGGGRGAQTPEQIEAARQQAAEIRTWRLGAPMARLKDLRQMYENAGVVIDVLKVDGLYSISNEELDYFFQMARDLGARAISAELPEPIADTRRIGAFADKHRIFMAYHHHAQAAAKEYTEVFTQARYNAANIDIGHWTAVQNASPLPFIAANHERIPHIHVKDRRLGTNGGANVPFGQGDTQIREILQAIRDNRWNIQATIEFEYPVPEGSDRVTEIKKSLAYCRDVLMA
jgi:sugar phosphate isomerase/epimerase